MSNTPEPGSQGEWQLWREQPKREAERPLFSFPARVSTTKTVIHVFDNRLEYAFKVFSSVSQTVFLLASVGGFTVRRQAMEYQLGLGFGDQALVITCSPADGERLVAHLYATLT